MIEMLLDERGFGGALCDLHLLAVTGGRERTRAEYERLLEAAGFTPTRVSRLPALCSVMAATLWFAGPAGQACGRPPGAVGRFARLS